MKSQLIEQGILSLLRRCIVETQFDAFLIKLPCLQIMLSLAFDEVIRAQLIQDTELLGTVRTLMESVQQNTKHAAENLLWQLEKRNKMMKTNMSVDVDHKYDIMISYSHVDKALCHLIHDQ